MELKHTAIVTVHGAPGLTQRQRKEIASWLRHQAQMIEKKSDKLAKRYTARYWLAGTR